MEEQSDLKRAVKRAQIRALKQAVEIVLEHDCQAWAEACNCVDNIAHDIEKAIERKRGLDN